MPSFGRSFDILSAHNLIICGSGKGNLTIWSNKTYKLIETLIKRNYSKFDVYHWKVKFINKGQFILGISNNNIYIWKNEYFY